MVGSQRKNGFLSICTGIRKSHKKKNDSEKTLKNKQTKLFEETQGVCEDIQGVWRGHSYPEDDMILGYRRLW